MSEQAPSVAGITVIAIDCAEPLRLAEWWQKLLGGRVRPSTTAMPPPSTRHYPDRLLPSAGCEDGQEPAALRHGRTDYRKAVNGPSRWGNQGGDVYDRRQLQVFAIPKATSFCILSRRAH